MIKKSCSSFRMEVDKARNYSYRSSLHGLGTGENRIYNYVSKG
ncbi:MAG: hypothetical protein ACLFUC_09680 [Bacteroidales bacterium]